HLDLPRSFFPRKFTAQTSVNSAVGARPSDLTVFLLLPDRLWWSQTLASRRLWWSRTLASRRLWWSRPGSNRRPPACKAGALPAELRPQGQMTGPGIRRTPRASVGWWAREDLNFRPHAYQARALTN